MQSSYLTHFSKRLLTCQALQKVGVQSSFQQQIQNAFGNKLFMNGSAQRWFAVQVIKVPKMGDSISEGTIQTFVKKPGEYVEADEIVAVIETDKVNVDIRSPQSGLIKQYFASEGDTVAVDANFFEIDPEAKASAKQEAPQAAPKKEEKAVEQPKKQEAQAAPPKQEEPKKQAPAATNTSAPKSTPPATQQQKAQKAPTGITGSRTETRVPMSRMRNRIAQRLKEAQNTNAMLTTFNEIDMSGFMNIRKEIGEAFAKKHGVKLGFMSAFVRASAAALKEQPVVNAVIDGNDMVYRDFIDISVAVSTPTGLVVPVLRNCQNFDYAGIEKVCFILLKLTFQELISLSNKARDGKLELEDMAGGTFTITNGGVFGSMMGTPIINPPQSAILGMHAIKNRPVCVGDKIEARPIMYVALTYDHRIIDGREAVLFLRKIKDCVEDPKNILFDL
ncbi:UNKNOWN [Stylonychia lemnae]|uniref:dihydrolipoyllysine-residue succinyltransferase n=1 Tax=Stylonychia lemnae TaxID=5949 RepID=A0A078BCY3_STYLE|nr:UNKNOWN [Stylonychia lemnae]|eukprot:CDW91453.1 UNKNOWN [Stylonychia lemnae]